MYPFTVIGIRTVDGQVDVLSARPGLRGESVDAGPAWMARVWASTPEEAGAKAVEQVTRGDRKLRGLS